MKLSHCGPRWNWSPVWGFVGDKVPLELKYFCLNITVARFNLWSCVICKLRCIIWLGLGLGKGPVLGLGLGQEFSNCACVISKLCSGNCKLHIRTNRKQRNHILTSSLSRPTQAVKISSDNVTIYWHLKHPVPAALVLYY